MTRRLIQLYSALLYNAHLRGFAEGEIYTGPTKSLCVPGLNCYSCPGAVGACPLGALQNAVAASADRPAFYVVGLLLLFGLLLGRVICGFLCPFGLLQELLHKLPGKKVKKSPLTRGLSRIKYGILAVFVLAIPAWFAFKKLPLPAFCKYICPAGTLEGAVSLLLHPANGELRSLVGGLFWWKLGLCVGILAVCVFVYRAFCRFLCPLGALYGFLGKLALLGVRLDQERCTDCGACLRVCPVDIRKVGDSECVHCLRCVDCCPEQAISFRAGKLVLHGPDTAQPETRKKHGKKIAWAAALVLLAGVLIFANLPTAQRPTGAEAGQQLPDFSVTCLDGSRFTLSEQRGKTVVINLWATWCTPCVQELPNFDRLLRERPDKVAVLALHSELVTSDVAAYLEDTSYEMPFAVDEDGSLGAILNASTVLPQTVIVDPDGVVIYNQVGALDYETLCSLVDGG